MKFKTKINNLNWDKIILIILLLSGAFLRFYNLNWDQGNMFHPDERNIANAVTKISFFKQLNPDFFAYGGFSIYLIRATGDVLVRITNNPVWIHDWGHINLIARFYSALYSTITILFLYHLARKVFNERVALISAFFFTFSVSSIQTSHLGITENFLTLTVVLISLLSLNIFQKPSLKNYIICAIVTGIAIAAKTTAISFLIFPATAFLINLVLYKKDFSKKILMFLFYLILSLCIFSIFSPYTFLSWNKFLESMRYESGVALGTLPVPYTLQFTNTSSYLFQFINLFWQLGPITLILPLGLIFVFIKLIKNKDFKLLILLSFPVIYFLYVGMWHTKFIRFMMPVLPFLTIFASYFLYVVIKRTKIAGKFLLCLFALTTIFWAFAFFSVYTREQTRISASKWIYKNIPSGSKILGEHWDDGLPVSLKNYSPAQYQIKQLTIYDADNLDKIDYYSNELSSADYIVINSRRLYGTLIHLDKKYPTTSKYYKLLFNGNLGYKKVAEFTSYPSIFGITINDDSSEETFQVYDHPKVIIFKNTQRLIYDDIKNQF
ncbi:MAG: glycosyltransferase family 39 protein [Patescibacteria group bacterium]|nr:glycosyltransferase family 39 protein [Patescibacteria group bacterium]